MGAAEERKERKCKFCSLRIPYPVGLLRKHKSGRGGGQRIGHAQRTRRADGHPNFVTARGGACRTEGETVRRWGWAGGRGRSVALADFGAVTFKSDVAATFGLYSSYAHAKDEGFFGEGGR